jgi:hypothetical protein
VDGVATMASFMGPWGIARRLTALYVVDWAGQNIRRIESGVVTAVAGPTTSGVFGYQDGTGTNVVFSAPRDIAVMGSNLVIADRGNGVIRLMTTAGVVTSYTIKTKRGLQDGPPGTYQIGYIFGIASDGVNVFFTDNIYHMVRCVNSTGSVVYLLSDDPRHHVC